MVLNIADQEHPAAISSPSSRLTGLRSQALQLRLEKFQLYATAPGEMSHGPWQSEAKPKSSLVDTFSSPCPKER